MGWFWADSTSPTSQALPHSRPSDVSASAPPPAGCLMHKRTMGALNSCPIRDFSQKPAARVKSSLQQRGESRLPRLNPLNHMFHGISQSPASGQLILLPTERDESSIPKGSGEGHWEYPSPQQMYNALRQKGYYDTDITAVESMVAVHNFLNEGAWAEIVEWERRFGKGLARGWEASRRGEENAHLTLSHLEALDDAKVRPALIRFQGRPNDMTPKSTMLQVLAWILPEKFGTERPFDRHDWYVSRNVGNTQQEIRYVIDYYSGPPEPTGEPVFYLDVRPAMTPTGAIERLIRWGGDFWWRASGGLTRDEASSQKSTRP